MAKKVPANILARAVFNGLSHQLDPRCSSQGPSRRLGASVGGVSTESRVVVQPLHRGSAQNAALLLLMSIELMSCCAAGTNGCVDLRHRAFP